MTNLDIPAKEHNYSAWINEVGPTCTIIGTKGHFHCTDCNKNFDAGKNELTNLDIPAKGHIWSEATQEKPSTCEICGATNDDKLPEDIPSIDDEPIHENEHICDGGNAWNRFWRAIFNFFRRMFGLPEKCPHGKFY